MPPRPEVEPLSRKHRRLVFALSLLTFATAVPAFVFYAIGYRFDFDGDISNIRAVGGMYISSEAEDIAIYVDDEPVENMRIFQNAAYVQNLEAGLHQVHVQGDDINTWVKLLPVYAHFVTEASSFNLPERPQVRLVTKYETEDGLSVIDKAATSTFSFASTTNSWYATTTKATTTFELNPEYTYISELIASTTIERATIHELELINAERFRFGSNNFSLATTTATTTQVFRDVVLYEDGDEVMAKWIGDSNRIPYYYCVTYSGEMATALAYGSHVMADLKSEYGTTTDWTDESLAGQQLCRESIRVDRIGQSVQSFYFLPDSEHHVVMQLQDGVYVAEIDDRSWQNVQLLYPGDYLELLVDGGQIYIEDGEYLLEVYTELQ